MDYGKQGAPLNDTGILRAKALRAELQQYGLGLDREPVAVSELLRTSQTAEQAGCKLLVVNPLLNEVNTGDPAKTNELISQGMVPKEAIVAARKLLAQPPAQKVWFTHGLVVAALLRELHRTDKFVPDFCEIVEMEF